jgi:hypothetical protein
VIYNCCNENRKSAIAGNTGLGLNGIDYLEVLDHEAEALGIARQTTLLIHCLNPLTQPSWSPSNVLITGGESITGIFATWVAPALSPPPDPQTVAAERTHYASLPDAANVIVVRTSVAGDFSPYLLQLVNNAAHAAEDPFAVTEVLSGFDLQLAEVSFSFKVECGPFFDCAPQTPVCPPDQATPPPINYLAKDYGSFRTLILDRLSQLLPDWAGTSEADLGVALAELAAYVGDRLSYQQDAVATEAYLETARRRVSLRRHALLVDYHVNDGSNARAWIHVKVAGNTGQAVPLTKKKTQFYTFAPGMPSSLDGHGNKEAALMSGVQVFEPMADADLYPEHNHLHFYTWGDTDCCLPTGSTEATLRGYFPNLAAGDVLVFEEVKGPQTGKREDADISHRCAVQLTHVAVKDGQGNLLKDALFGNQPVTEIQWAEDDALTFPLCISSSSLDSSGNTNSVSAISAAYGNIVLADNGLSFKKVKLGTVPAPTRFYPPNPAADRCNPVAPTPIPVRFMPAVPDGPLSQIPSPATTASASAYASMNPDLTTTVPKISLEGTLNGVVTTWSPLPDLLESRESDPVFVVEVESDGTATLRFGDDTNGSNPDAGTTFTADYRVGNGTAGNVGPDSLVYLVPDVSVLPPGTSIISCRNPLPAAGGTDPEDTDQIRRRAPQAFMQQERAVTMADYETVAESNTKVEQAVANLRWTGSWYTVFIAVEPVGGGNLGSGLKKALKKNVERYRLAGQDLELDSPDYVSLEIVLEVCVSPDYFASDVEEALQQVLGSQILPNGTKGLFYPDNFTFGQTVYLSPIYEAARSVPGVSWVLATTFQTQGVDTDQYLKAGELKLGALQVARLANDPSYPDWGQLTLNMQGGR